MSQVDSLKSTLYLVPFIHHSSSYISIFSMSTIIFSLILLLIYFSCCANSMSSLCISLSSFSLYLLGRCIFL